MIFSPSPRSDDTDLSDCQPESLGCMVTEQTDEPSISADAQTPVSTAHPKALTTEAVVGILGIVGILLIAIVAFFAIMCGFGCKCGRSKKKTTRRNVRVRPGVMPRKAESTTSSINQTPEMKHTSTPGIPFDVERNNTDNINHPSPKSIWDLRSVKLGHGVPTG